MELAVQTVRGGAGLRQCGADPVQLRGDGLPAPDGSGDIRLRRAGSGRLLDLKSSWSAVGMSKASGAKRRTSSRMPCSLEERLLYKVSAAADLALTLAWAASRASHSLA